MMLFVITAKHLKYEIAAAIERVFDPQLQLRTFYVYTAAEAERIIEIEGFGRGDGIGVHSKIPGGEELTKQAKQRGCAAAMYDGGRGTISGVVEYLLAETKQFAKVVEPSEHPTANMMR